MKKLLLVSAVGLALSGCGGGSGGGNNDNNGGSVTPPVTPPTNTVNTVTGSIESISGNQITVNGRNFTISTVEYQGQALKPSVLTTDMMVKINTATKTDRANVTLEPSMAGIVTERKGTSFSVNGIPLEFATLSDDIDVGDWVFVSSLPTANAGYKVLSVVKIDVNDDENGYPGLANFYEIEGRIAQIGQHPGMLVLGSNIYVDYTNAKLPQTGLKIGQWIEVEGHDSGDHFTATEIELDGYDADDAFENSDIEGIVTSVENLHTSTPSFTLNYRGSFATNSSTCYRLDDSYRCDSNLKKNLKQGVEVEITSKFVSGQRIASIIEFEQPDWDDNQGNWQGKEFECEGRVSNAIYSADTNELVSFTVSHCENDAEQIIADNKVMIDAQTRFENIDKMNIDGSLVEVEGVIINEQNIAREIELED